MSLANKVNTGRQQTVREGIDTKSLEYFKAKEMCFTGGDPIVVVGFFIQSGKYGESVTLVALRGLKDNPVPYGINIPKRYAEMFKNLTAEEIEEVKAGKLGIASIQMMETDNGTTVSIEFCDL